MYQVRRRLVVAVIASSLWVQSCSQQPEPVITTAAQVDSGFDFITEAFVFENFGGDAIGTQLDTPLMERMFGSPAVCAPDSDPCALTTVASAWMTSTNATLDAGRSEGFATLSLLFHADVLDPNDFGAENVAELRLSGNPDLQAEFAYWAATQAVPSASIANQRYSARDVMPFLERALAPDAEGAWRLAIAQRTEIGFQRGHALVPIGYYRGEGGSYWLRVYDNNFPGREQLLEITPEAGTWRYAITGLLGEEIVYEGTPDNGNLLYFANVLERQGVFQAPFAPDSDAFTVVTSGLTAVVEIDGEQTGVVDGEVVEFGEDRVMPAFSACPLCGTPVDILNQNLIDKGIRSYDQIEVRMTGDSKTNISADGSQIDRRAKSITNTGPGYSTTVTPSGSTEGDEVEFRRGGRVNYRSKDGDAISIETTRTNEDGSSTSVRITVTPPPDSTGSFDVLVDNRGEGGSRVSVDDLPEGSLVTYELTEGSGDDASTESVSFPVKGSANIETDEEGRLSVEGTDVGSVNTGTCANGVLDSLVESDVDCGNLCGPCSHGKACESARDCKGACVDRESGRVCETPQCTNSIRDLDETDVDCGGTECPACASANDDSAGTCVVDSDCSSNRCTSGRCRLGGDINVRIDGEPPTDAAAELRVRIDGGEPQRLAFPRGQSEFVLGEGFSYVIEHAGPCRTDFGVVKTALEGDLVLDCPTNGVNYLIIAPQLPYATTEFDPMSLRVTLDGVPSEITYTGAITRFLGEYAQDWEVRVIAQPEEATYGFGGAEHLFCEVSFGSNARVSSLVGEEMSCSPRMNPPNCSDNVRNQDESGRDCGGVCDPCADGVTCNVTEDCDTRECQSFSCSGDVVDTCTDGRVNYFETDVDCGAFVDGAPRCDRCVEGQSCTFDGNCGPGLGCEGAVCIEFDCDDGRQNGNETGLDCGGPDCGACASGGGCALGSDCLSGVCDNGTCAAPTCVDGIQNGDEPATDCGGSSCGGCADGLACTQPSDCTSAYCVSNVCTAPTCSDGVRNQDESDVDCGGATSGCPRCAGTLSCGGGSDCASNMCTNGSCTSLATCSDGIQNQGETAIDCGGPNCSGCSVGTACTQDTECASGSCECGATSGNCAGASGTCSEGQFFIDQPVTDGTTASGTYTIPAGCDQLYVQAWGAGGGGAESMGFVSMQGGGAGFVDGTISVTPGDTVTVWLGQGGESGFNTGGAGSYLGTAANGGSKGFGMFGADPGGGGGLTSVQITGTTPHAFSVPAGAGADEFGTFTTTVSVAGGGGAAGYAGDIGSNDQGGGGAGDPGGTENTPGAYGTMPSGLSANDGDANNFTPAGTTNADYSRCLGANMINAGAGDMTFGSGGDGCVVLRCVEP